jgi:hypothetical protein
LAAYKIVGTRGECEYGTTGGRERLTDEKIGLEATVTAAAADSDTDLSATANDFAAFSRQDDL